MRVVATKSFVGEGRVALVEGMECEIPDQVAADWLRLGLVRRVEKLELAVVGGAVEKAVIRTRGGR